MAMNILCPNCQKQISLDEQHAGQLLKCPLCAGTFAVPMLPPAAPPLASTSAHPGVTPGPVGTPTTESYGLAPEPAPPPPRFEVPPLTSGPAAGAHIPPRETAAPPPPPPPGGYVHVRTYRLHPQVVRWVAPAALVLVFILSFFTWVGMYPGGERVLGQSAWKAAFGAYTVDRLWETTVSWERLKEGEGDEHGVHFGWSPWLVLAGFLFLGALAAGLLSSVPDPERIPVDQVSDLWPWRQLIVAGLAGGSLLLLLLVLLTGFPVENKTRALIERHLAEQKSSVKSDDAVRRVELQEAENFSQYNLRRTCWLGSAFFLLIVAVIGALLDYWLERRGARPWPRMDVMW